MSTRHFLTLLDFSPKELADLIDRAVELKALHQQESDSSPFPNKVLGMVFEKASTRTRISFEAGMTHLGGSAIFLSSRDTQLGRGEPIEDSARVMSRMVDLIMVRTFEHEKIQRFAEHSKVPVINALTDDYHPCQLLADMQTFTEHRGRIEGKTVTWVGDGNNMCNSYINAARQFNFELRIACPEGFDPMGSLLEDNKDRVHLMRDPIAACRDSDLVITDTWASMGQEEEKRAREQAFAGFQVNHELMTYARNDALFMHCLPAYRDQEVSAKLLDDENSVVWDEAENRLHAQKALMEFLLES